MMRAAAPSLGLALSLALMAPSGAARAGDTARLSEAQRQAIHAEIRALLLSEPTLVTGALAASDPRTADPFADAVADDRALLDRLAPRLFGPDLPRIGPEGAPLRVALLTGPDCALCPRARAELAALAQDMGFQASLVATEADPGLMEALELDLLPAYVVGEIILRGHIPPIVLERTLSR